MARYVVGIDLGTSNTSVAYSDLREVESSKRPRIHIFDIPQLVSVGDVQARALLPSSLYSPSKLEFHEAQTRLPWHEDDTVAMRAVVGFGARKLGAKTSIRLIESAKSWLCHGGVNRTASILPWHAPDEIPKMSPVDVSAAFLRHIADAWDFEIAKGDATLALREQDLIITVPASFDEVARRLTLEAAKKAKLENVTLIEEPLAAFYAFIARTGGTCASTGLNGGERVLIADVGGGTSDFTLIEVEAPKEDGGILNFKRTAVGDHLLLGGDNMDLALAHAIEPELSKGKKQLKAEAWAQLKQECRAAKEALFTDLTREDAPIILTGKGQKMIGDTMKAKLTRTKLEQVILEGYYPKISASEAAKTSGKPRIGFAEYGLPFAQEPAITRHLAAFLMKHAKSEETFCRVDALLYNGGTLKPVVVRERIQQLLGSWFRESEDEARPDPKVLVYDQGDDALEFAVSRGAAYFGLVRLGKGLRIGGGSPREYFLGLDDEAQQIDGNQQRLLCIAPRGMQDGQQLEVSDREFQLVTNRPVTFPIFTSTAPTVHKVGDIITMPLDELHALPPLQTVVKFGKQKAGTTVPIRIQAKRSELGTLELSCFSKMSGARFRLEFDLRSADQSTPAATPFDDKKPADAKQGKADCEPFGGAGTRAPPDIGEVDEAKLEAAKHRVSEIYQLETPRPDPEKIMKGLESDFEQKRDQWPLPALRPLAEHLLELSERRALSPELEARWLNLAGFCLRPGDGFPLDDWRVRQLWKIHSGGLVHGGRDPCELNWWILWRRVAGGLSRGHQQELSSELFPRLIPDLAKRANKRPPKPQTQLAVEMWRAAAALERIGAKSRAQVGDALVELIQRKKTPRSGLWCLGRIGARKLLYGPREATVKAASVEKWIDILLGLNKLSKHEPPKDCLISLARLVGDRQFDLDEATRLRVAAYLVKRGTSEAELRPLREVVELQAAERVAAFGEGLPTGIKLQT